MAAVAELVDAHDSNSCGGDSVRVRFPLAAQKRLCKESFSVSAERASHLHF